MPIPHIRPITEKPKERPIEKKKEAKTSSDVRRDEKNKAPVLFLGILMAAVAILSFVSPLKGIFILVGVLFLFLSFWRPLWVVFFLAIFLPLEPFLLKFIPGEFYIYARFFSESLIYLLVISVGLRVLSGKKLIRTPLDIPLGLFVFVLIISSLLNLVPAFSALIGMKQILRFILLFLVVVNLKPGLGFIKFTTVILFLVVGFEAVLGIFQAVVGPEVTDFLAVGSERFLGDIQLTTGVSIFWDEGQRVFATLGRYDQLGVFLVFFLLLACGFLYSSPPKAHPPLAEGRAPTRSVAGGVENPSTSSGYSSRLRSNSSRAWLWVLLVVGLPALVLTYSRASWFGFLLGLFAVGYVLARDKRILISYLAAVLILVGYLAYSGLVVRYLIDVPRQSVAERFFEAFSYERWRGEYYDLGRLYYIVQTPLKVVPRAPVFGHGPGQYGGGVAAALHNTKVYDEAGIPFGVYGTEGYIDNNWFSLWGETGTLGLILYIWMFITLGLTAWHLYKKSRDPWEKGIALGFIGCLVVITFQAFLGSYLEVRTLGFYLWLYGAFAVALYEKVNHESINTNTH